MPLLPTSNIGSLFCAEVSRTPPIELIELVVDPRRLVGQELGNGFWGEADESTVGLALGRDISIPRKAASGFATAESPSLYAHSLTEFGTLRNDADRLHGGLLRIWPG